MLEQKYACRYKTFVFGPGLSFLFKKVVVCGHCLVLLFLTINEILKWLSSLPILMQDSFWR